MKASRGLEETKRDKTTEMLNKVIELLKTMETKPEDYKPRERGRMPPIHDEILKRIKENLESRFRKTFAEYGIDYVKREDRDPEYGRIELAVEVDRWRSAFGSWKKLLDVRADNRIWVFIPDDDREDDFQWSLGKIKELIESRGDDKTISGSFIAVFKRPTHFKAVNVLTHENLS